MRKGISVFFRNSFRCSTLAKDVPEQSFLNKIENSVENNDLVYFDQVILNSWPGNQ